MSKLKYYDGTNWKTVNGEITGDTLPIGAIIPYCSTTAPANWLVCDGSYVSKETYADLYNIIGDDYLDGGTAPTGTFRLPNLKGKVPVGYNSSETEFDTIGETGGEKKHLLILNELPSQAVSGYCADDKKSWATGAFGDYSSAAYPTNVVNASGRGTGDQPHNNLQPYQVVCYIIKAKQSAGVVANVSNTYSTSETDTYSCDYVNKISDYSTTETPIGKWIDGKPIYRKVFDFGAMPNNTTKDITHNISNLGTTIKCYGMAIRSSDSRALTIPDSNPGAEMMVSVSNTVIMVTTTGDRSSFDDSFIVIEYTKTTD